MPGHTDIAFKTPITAKCTSKVKGLTKSVGVMLAKLEKKLEDMALAKEMKQEDITLARV